MGKRQRIEKRVVTVHVHAEDVSQTVSVNISGLEPDQAHTVVKAAHDEAIKLLETRARLRHFKKPVTVRTFNSAGHLITKFDGSEWTWGEDSPERGQPGSIVFEDARGRRASVRLEISR